MLGAYRYELLEMEPREAVAFVQARRYRGLNVTIPYKKLVLPLCDWVEPGAAEAGCANTLVLRGGRLEGYNTDIGGFEYLAGRAGIAFAGGKTLVLGSGGAGAAAALCARRLGAGSVVTVSRGGEENYGNLFRHHDAEVLVNATPVGMYPAGGASPVTLEGFTRLRGVLDMVYNPLRTALALDAARRGIPAACGLPMLAAQAVLSSGLFTGTAAPLYRTEEIVRAVAGRMGSLVFVGMPGCGKSTVGKAAAAALGKRFVDTDEEIEKRTGRPIPAFFQERGEAAFRDMESAVIAEAGREGGLVIATGGGTVLREENYLPLRANGLIVGLRRDIDRLPRQGRPLSQGADLLELSLERMPRYERFAGAWIDNNGRVEDTVRAALEAYDADTCR